MTVWDARQRQSWQEHAQDAYDTTIDYIDDYHARAWAIEDAVNARYAVEIARQRELNHKALENYWAGQPANMDDWREMLDLTRTISQAQYDAYQEFRADWAREHEEK